MVEIRLEREGERRAVEELTREAFWNKYQPGCDEHFVLHLFRGRPDFVRELDYVLTVDGVLTAHIMYCKAEIAADGGRRVPVAMFGPVSVLPAEQGKGYGSQILSCTLERAKELGSGAVAITGSPDYYHRFGFVSGSSLGVRYKGIPEGEEASFFMIKELDHGFLDGVSGIFSEPDGYAVDKAAREEYDRSFPPKKKEKLPGQLFG